MVRRLFKQFQSRDAKVWVKVVIRRREEYIDWGCFREVRYLVQCLIVLWGQEQEDYVVVFSSREFVVDVLYIECWLIKVFVRFVVIF